MKIDRVILACDDNSDYLELWPIVSKVWSKRFGLIPTLVYVSNNDTFPYDIGCGELIQFKPIEHIPTDLQARCIRLLAPCVYPTEVSIISDIDMIPINKNFFFGRISFFPNERFIQYIRYNQMCYNAALGSTWKEVFKVKEIGDFRNIMKSWYDTFGGKRTTDQLTLRKYLNNYNSKNTIQLYDFYKKYNVKRLSRYSQNIEFMDNINIFDYVDYHIHLPYSENKEIVDKVVNLVLSE